jgi:hypothetical protein
MINFLRSFRRSFIEENKMSKYILYAFGEILLVVLGILIALQIDNWNEETKIKDSIAQHMKILKQNLAEDQAQLKVLRQAMKHNLNYSDSLLQQFQLKIPVDKFTTKFIVKLLLEYRFKANQNAMETITQSNEIPLLEEKLQTAILDYYALIEDTREREEIANIQIQTKYERYINDRYMGIFQRNNEWEVVKNYYKNDTRPIKVFNKKTFLADKTLETLVFSRFYQARELESFYGELLESSNSILKLLESKNI